MNIPASILNQFVDVNEIDETIWVGMGNDEVVKFAFNRSPGEFWMQTKNSKGFGKSEALIHSISNIIPC